MPIYLVVVFRSVVSFFVLLVLVRIMGKQQMSELTFFDYVVGITIGSIAATVSVEVNQNTYATMAGMTTWAALAIALAVSSLHNVWVRKVTEGEATVVIENGKILEKNLAKIRLSLDDLLAQLRTQGIFHLEDVEFALFETCGKLSVEKKSQKRNLTPQDLGLSTQYEGLPTTLIEDGTVLGDALRSLRLSRAWLQHQLARQGITDIGRVSLAQLDTRGNLHVDLQGDGPYYSIDTKE